MMYKREISLKQKIRAGVLTLSFIALILVGTGCIQNQGSDVNPPDGLSEAGEINLPGDSSDDEMLSEDSVTVDVADASDTDKMVNISMDTVGRANPFVPSRGGGMNSNEGGFDLVEPPTTLPDESAQKIISTKISGIMYDKYSPSAILNIDNSDYLVRSGDVIDGYKILAISPSTVTLQLGSNIYKAGVGQVVDGGEVNYNKVSNLSNKFGGSKK